MMSQQLPGTGYYHPQRQQYQPRYGVPSPYSFPAESSLASIPDPICPPSAFLQQASSQPPPAAPMLQYEATNVDYQQYPQPGVMQQPERTLPSQSIPYTLQRQQLSSQQPLQAMGEIPTQPQHPSIQSLVGQMQPPTQLPGPPQPQMTPSVTTPEITPLYGTYRPPLQLDRRLSASFHASQQPPQHPYPLQPQQSTNQILTNGFNPDIPSSVPFSSTLQPQTWRPGTPLLSAVGPSHSSTPSQPSLKPFPGPHPATNGIQHASLDPRCTESSKDLYQPLQQPQQHQTQSLLSEEDLDTIRLTAPPQVKVETLTKNTNSRIDPTFVPRPVLSTEPISQPGGKRFETDKYTIPPPPFGVYTIIDRGSASCRFVRVSLNQIPAASQTLKSTGIPLVVSASPFPIQGEYEDEVPSVNLNKGSAVVSEGSESEGPQRCSRCHSYISPFMTFPDEHNATCNFCGHTFMLSNHYQYALAEYTRLRHSEYTDNISKSLGQFDRLELVHGTVDWAAPLAFLQVAGISGVPRAATKSAFYQGELCLPAPAFCFAIDTSASAQQAGLTIAAIGAIKYALGSITNSAMDVCIITFDQTIKFYPMVKRSDYSIQNQQQIFVVSDITDPFFPSHPNTLFKNATKSKSELESLLDELPQLLQADLMQTVAGAPPVTRSQSCGNAALRACVQLLSSRGGGTVKIFYGNSPDIGMGAIQRMNLASATNKDQIIHPLHPVPSLSSFYSELVADCINNGVAIDVFIGALQNKHIGVSTLGYAARRTGGYCTYYGNFNLNKAYQQLCMDLSRQLEIPQNYDCIFKIRCSRGLTISKMMIAASLGIGDQRTDFVESSQFRMPRIDSDQMLMFEMKHEGDILEDNRAAYIQYAVLHTTISGIRRIRVVTLAVAVTNSLSTTFRYSEIESVLAYFVRKTANAVMLTQGTKWRDELIGLLVEILYSYRLNCAATTSSGQLILPDALKSLPVYISGLLKNAAFRSGTDLFSDEKDFLLSRLLHVPLHQLIISIYPRLYVLHRSYSQFKGEKLQRIGCDTGIEGEVYLPPIAASTGEKITSDGLYLLDNGLIFMIYIGIDVDPIILNEIFGTADLDEQFTQTFNCEELKGNLGRNINRGITQLRKIKGLSHPWQSISIVRPRSLEEALFTSLLVEDKHGSEPSYVDFLCQLHKSVYHKMEDS